MLACGFDIIFDYSYIAYYTLHRELCELLRGGGAYGGGGPGVEEEEEAVHVTEEISMSCSLVTQEQVNHKSSR